MSTDRPATTDPADLIAREVATSIIAAQLTRSWADRIDAARRARHIVAALDRAGYTVAMMPIRPDGSTAAPRVSEAVRGDGSPTPAEEAAQGGEGGSAAESEPLPMRPEDVPSEWIWIAREAHRTAPQKRDGKPTRMRHAIAAVAPLIRAQAIADAYNEVTKLHDASTYQDGYGWFERAAYANVLDALTRIARGDQ